MPVLDASVLVEYLADGEHAEAAKEQIFGLHHAVWAPELIDAEVGHVLRRAVHLGKLDEEAAGEAVWYLDDLPIRRISHQFLFRYAWLLRDQVSFYDALYVALASMMDQPLITLDERLARSGVEAEIEVLGQLA
jgi:predicted nucleic acid-binding protein